MRKMPEKRTNKDNSLRKYYMAMPHWAKLNKRLRCISRPREAKSEFSYSLDLKSDSSTGLLHFYQDSTLFHPKYSLFFSSDFDFIRRIAI